MQDILLSKYGEVEVLKVIINSKIERENDKTTNTFVMNYSDENIIKTIMKKMETIKKDEVLNKIIYLIIEDNSIYEKKDELIEREIKRSIGYTNKIRVVFAIDSAGKAVLIITADNRTVSYIKIVSLYKYIMGINTVFEKDNLLNGEICNSSSALSWGVPSWNSQQVFTKCNSVDINGDNIKEIKTCSKDNIITALMAALYKYKSTSAKVLIKENTSELEKVKAAVTDENQSVKFIEEGDFDKEALDAYESGIVFTDVIDSNCEYYPFLTAVYPITLCVTENNGVVRNIRVMAGEKAVNEVVLEQFTKLFVLYLNEINDKHDHTISSLNKLKLNHKIYTEFAESVENTMAKENYRNYNIVKVINEIADKYPERIAVSYENINIKYSELSEKSDILAKRLLAKGVKAGEKIVVSIPQDQKLIILIQAIIKAGAVYIPVDPDYPLERISFIVEDSGADYVISSLPEDTFGREIKNISYDELCSCNDKELIKDIELCENPKENGYVIYTSGTTGKPKGVSVPAKNIVALINAVKDEFDLNEFDIWTMFHSYSFDFSVWEMWGCLLTGGKLVVVPRETAKSHYDLHSLLKEEKVTVFNQTPASFYALEKVDSENRGAQLTSIRLVIFGGEALDTSKLDVWFKRYPSTKCRVVNMYGITETTIHVTFRNVHAREQDYLAKSVGKALAGWEISIRNKEGELCLVGMEGEMWVSGVGVANGYLNRDELNKEKFVIDENNKKWYRSGDLGRFRAEGSVDYLGRIDNQVKIRGFRIELDEIKNNLLKIPYVEDAVVSVFNVDENDAAKKQIYAFIKVSEEHNQEETKKYLLKKLPQYMIPGKIVNVEEFPMTINGKVDYKLLMADANKSHIKNKGITKNESDLCLEIWSQVLGAEVSDDDEFFKSGGNSLLAVELASELKKRIDSTLKLKDVYINCTPRKMKMFLEKRRAELIK
jgi:amino acid adenylation domain-containing protein